MKYTPPQRVIAGAAAVLIFSSIYAPVAQASNGAHAISTSPRSAGRGGTELAIGDDAYSVISNPAGMTHAYGYRIDLGLNIRFSNVSFTNELNRDFVERGFPGVVPSLAMVYDFGAQRELESIAEEHEAMSDAFLKSMEWVEYEETLPFDFGFALWGVAGSSANSTFRTPVFPDGLSQRSKFQVAGLTLAGSWRVGPRVSVGMSIHLLHASIDQNELAGSSGNTNGLVRNFNGDQVNQADEFFLVNGDPITWSEIFDLAGSADSLSSSRIDVDDAKGFGIAAQVGVLVEFTRWLSVGATFRTPGVFDKLKGEAFLDSRQAVASSGGALDQIQADFLDNHLPNDGAFMAGNYDFELAGLRMPAILGLGIAMRPHDQVMLAMDVKWINWADSFDEWDVTLSNGTSADINEVSSNQQSSTIETTSLRGWKDQVVVALGIVFSVNDTLNLRLGYNYGNSPVPSNVDDPFKAPNIEHHATIGFGLKFESVSVQVAYVHGFRKSITIGEHLDSADFSGIRHTAEQDSLWLGLSWEY